MDNIIQEAFYSHMKEIKNCDAEILDYVEQLEDRIEELEAKCDECPDLNKSMSFGG